MTAVTIILASVAISIDVYAQNTTITQHEIVNLTNTTNTTITAATPTIPISGLNASIIINTINAKIRSVYDDGVNDIPTSPESAIITKSDNKNIVK